MSRLATHIARRLVSARKEAGLTQEEVARRADVTAQYISRLERAVSDAPRRVELEKVAAVFGLAADDLMGLGDEAIPEDEDAESLADVQRRLVKVTGDRKISVGFLRAATHRDRIPKSAWTMIELAIEAANDSIPRDEDSPKSQE